MFHFLKSILNKRSRIADDLSTIPRGPLPALRAEEFPEGSAENPIYAPLFESRISSFRCDNDECAVYERASMGGSASDGEVTCFACGGPMHPVDKHPRPEF